MLARTVLHQRKFELQDVRQWRSKSKWTFRSSKEFYSQFSFSRPPPPPWGKVFWNSFVTINWWRHLSAPNPAKWLWSEFEAHFKHADTSMKTWLDPPPPLSDWFKVTKQTHSALRPERTPHTNENNCFDVFFFYFIFYFILLFSYYFSIHINLYHRISFLKV